MRRRTMDRLHCDVIIAVVISGEDAKLQLNQVNILQELNYGLSLVRIFLGWRGLQSCQPSFSSLNFAWLNIPL